MGVCRRTGLGLTSPRMPGTSTQHLHREEVHNIASHPIRVHRSQHLHQPWLTLMCSVTNPSLPLPLEPHLFPTHPAPAAMSTVVGIPLTYLVLFSITAVVLLRSLRSKNNGHRLLPGPPGKLVRWTSALARSGFSSPSGRRSTIRSMFKVDSSVQSR